MSAHSADHDGVTTSSLCMPLDYSFCIQNSLPNNIITATLLLLLVLLYCVFGIACLKEANSKLLDAATLT